MVREPTERSDGELAYRLRSRLAVVQAQTELLLDDPELPSARREGLARIQRASYELAGIVERERSLQADPCLVPVPDEERSESVDQILVCTHDERIADAVRSHPTDRNPAVDVVAAPAEAHDAISDRAVDVLLVDAVWPDETGIDVCAKLYDASETPLSFALLSLSVGASTPLSIGLSGVLSPVLSEAGLRRSLAPFVAEPETASVAGVLTERPSGALGARLADGAVTTIESDEPVDDRLPTVDAAADVVYLDPTAYRRLSASDVERLRRPTGGSVRPLLLVAPTEHDPLGRSWIPTLGGRQFLSHPPDVAAVIAAVLAERSTPAPTRTE